MKTLFGFLLTVFISVTYAQQTPQIFTVEILQNNLPSADTSLVSGGGDSIVTTVQNYSTDIEMILVLSDTTGVDEFLFDIYNGGQVVHSFTKVQSDNIRGSVISSGDQNYHFRFRIYGVTLPVGEKFVKAKINNSNSGVISNKERYF